VLPSWITQYGTIQYPLKLKRNNSRHVRKSYGHGVSKRHGSSSKLRYQVIPLFQSVSSYQDSSKSSWIWAKIASQRVVSYARSSRENECLTIDVREGGWSFCHSNYRTSLGIHCVVWAIAAHQRNKVSYILMTWLNGMSLEKECSCRFRPHQWNTPWLPASLSLDVMTAHDSDTQEIHQTLWNTPINKQNLNGTITSMDPSEIHLCIRQDKSKCCVWLWMNLPVSARYLARHRMMDRRWR